MRPLLASALLVLATGAIAAAQQPKPPDVSPRSAPAPAKGTQSKQKAPVASTPAAKEPEREETIEEIVERVTRRLQQKATRPSKPPVNAAPAPEPEPRVKLVWRPSVMWPTELVAEK
ncbi:MAG TPA: hypothetical protein VFV95_02270 [Vicinamibacterales bacterium]|nr:hypothetical protein [Vicinamibacterales bacterium]